MECTNVFCVSKVVVSGFLNHWRDKICEKWGCKNMGYFVKDDYFVLIASIWKGYSLR